MKKQCFIHVIDWCSYYLSELNNADIMCNYDHLKGAFKVK